MKTLISVVGATGIGKTRLAIELAKHFSTEIVSCDSRQLFRELNIGTAAPTAEELAEVPHHFIGTLSVQDYYSIGQYETEALAVLENLFENHETAVLVGGSMMYEKAVIEGLNDLPEADAANQNRLQEIWRDQGYAALQGLLQELDPEYYDVVDKENPRRILRAIDIIWQTGEKYSVLISKPKPKRNFNVVRIGIDAPRGVIYQRINDRVDQMMRTGLLEEARSVLPFRELVPLKTVGYTELFKYLNGTWSLETAVEEIKKNSRRFAKRQLTWYRGEQNIRWVPYDNPVEEAITLLNNLKIEQFGNS